MKAIKKIIRFFQSTSIQSIILISFSFIVLFSLLILGVVAITLNFATIETNTRSYTNQLIGQVNRNIESYIMNMNNILDMSAFNNDIKEYLSNMNLNTVEKGNFKGKIDTYFNSILLSHDDISSIIVFGYNGNCVINTKRGISILNPYLQLQEQKWYIDAIKANGKSVISSPHVQNIVGDKEYPWVVSFSRAIKNDKGDIIGVLLIDLRFNVINDMCKKIEFGKRGYIFIVDKDGNIIYHPQQQLIYTGLKNEMIQEVLSTTGDYFYSGKGEDNRLYITKLSEKTGWKIVGVAYINELVSNRDQIIKTYLFWGIVCYAIAIILSIIISSRISRPIKNLEVSMSKTQNGNFDIQVEVKSKNEIGQLSNAFNIMIKRTKELMKQNILEQELKRKSEIKALQAQINPHFLYNTLDSIIWMAESGKNSEVVKMTSALAKLFRFSISKGEDISTIKDEIEHIRNYLTIQQMRYRDKLTFKIDVEAEILQYKVPKLILQPLVENAIYHGIKYKTETGVIQILGKRIGDDILIQICDNGPGISLEKAKDVLENQIEPSTSNSIGIRNVNERIKLYYSKKYGLSFKNAPEGGTIVNIFLPANQ